MTTSSYICPFTHSKLTEADSGLVREDGKVFPYLEVPQEGNPIPAFLDPDIMNQTSDPLLQAKYHQDNSDEIYDNFLKWLFETFRVSENEFRSFMASKLNVEEDSKILVTGAGLGDDLPCIYSMMGSRGELYAQDLSAVMVAGMQKRISRKISSGSSAKHKNIFLSVGNAETLPFRDGFFDAAFHFGGINFYKNIGAAILEMDRVVRSGGKVTFGDEGVAPWLKEKEYGKMAIRNIGNWDSDAPLVHLPETCKKVNVTWILGNCFYLIDYEVSNDLPFMDIDIPHKGSRGGSIRTRYFGQLEGVDPKLKAAVIKAAASKGESVHHWLEKALSRALPK